MESFKKISVFKPQVDLTTDLQILIRNYIQSLKDVEIDELTPNVIKLEYYPQQYSVEYIERELKSLGVKLNNNNKKKGFFKRLLANLAKDNKEAFGEKKLDCCKLPKNK